MKRMLCALVVGLTTGTGWAQGEVRLGLLEIKGAPTEAPSPFAWLIGSDQAPTLCVITERAATTTPWSFA